MKDVKICVMCRTEYPKLMEGTSKNSDADESAESFPSYFTKSLRVGVTTRAKFYFI